MEHSISKKLPLIKVYPLKYIKVIQIIGVFFRWEVALQKWQYCERRNTRSISNGAFLRKNHFPQSVVISLFRKGIQ